MNTPRTRVVRRPVHGVLLLDKPLGLSSNQALQKVKWLLRAQKAGHTGTLDPLATGVLPLAFGAATKFSSLHLDADKCYHATLALGISTSTGDREGQMLERRPVPALTDADLEAVRQRFSGPISQLPPMHSALKKDGKPLYEYARDGQDVERTPREVLIHDLRLARIEDEQGTPAVAMRVHCSKGTYVRTLGEDLARALGTVAHLSMLRRVTAGVFDESRCVSLDALEAMDEEARMACLLPPEAMLAGHEQIILGNDDAGRFLTGLRRRGDWADTELVAVYGDQPRLLLGMAHVCAGELIADRLLSPLELEQMLAQAASG